MNKPLVVLSFLGLAAVLSSCAVDPYGNVAVVGGVSPGYYGDPYYVYGGTSYYYYNGGYCYYDHGRRVMVSHVPGHPPHRDFSHHDYRGKNMPSHYGNAAVGNHHQAGGQFQPKGKFDATKGGNGGMKGMSHQGAGLPGHGAAAATSKIVPKSAVLKHKGPNQ